MLMMMTRHFDVPLTPEQAFFWLEVALETGNLKILKWYMENHELDEHAIAHYWRDPSYNSASSLFNKLRMFTLHLQKHGFAAAGHWHIAQWLIPRLPPHGFKAFMRACTVAAARQGKLDMLQWLLELPDRPPLTPHVAAAAAENSNPAILRCLRAHDLPWNWRCYLASIRSGLPAALERLREHGCPVHVRSLYNNISLASVHHKVLPWMAAHVPRQDQLNNCSHGRLIFLGEVGWCMPDAVMQQKLCAAQARFCAYYGAARWLAKQRSNQCTLGSLDTELLQRIACKAGLDFSEMYDDLDSLPKVAAQSQPITMKQNSLLCLADSVMTEDDDYDASSCEDELLQYLEGPDNVLEAVTYAAALTRQPHRCWDGQQVMQLVEQGRAGTLWLACCTTGIDCGEDDSDNEFDWRPDASSHGLMSKMLP